MKLELSGNMCGFFRIRYGSGASAVFICKRLNTETFPCHRFPGRVHKKCDVRHIVGPNTYQRREVHLGDLPWEKTWHRPDNMTDITLLVNPSGESMARECFGVEALTYEVFSFFTNVRRMENFDAGSKLQQKPIQPVIFRIRYGRGASAVFI